MRTKHLLLSICAMIALSLAAQDGGKQKAFEAKVREVDGFHMVYYEFKGPYDQAFGEFMSLMEYLASNNIEMGPNALGIFYDDPQDVAPENLRSDVGFMVKSPAPSGEKFKYKKVEGFKAVSVKYYSMEDIQKAYESLGEYLVQSDLTPKGPAYEIYYSSDPNVVDTEILMPVE
ncbi:MAG: GyrI-like domain-containing protein [Bacteroidales bacterium]|nr:GyrI-like domain-containing protein [Bacteroidales bacterium]